MKEGWNDTGQKTAAELKNLRMLKERHKSTSLRMSAHCRWLSAGTALGSNLSAFFTYTVLMIFERDKLIRAFCFLF